MPNLRKDTKYFLFNNTLEFISKFPNLLFTNELSVYEVCRYQLQPIFYSDHLLRLKNAIAKLNFSLENLNIPDSKSISMLFEKNKIDIGNIRIDVFPKLNITLAYIIPHFYPTIQDYQNGVKTIFQYDERENQEIKIFHHQIKENTTKLLTDNTIFETILVNQNNEITEGSRSNLFFIKNNDIITANDNQVLQGITKKKLEDFLGKKEIKLTKRKILKEDIFQFEAAFLTGTSIGALPIKQMENKVFDINNDLFLKIVSGFNNLR